MVSRLMYLCKLCYWILMLLIIRYGLNAMHDSVQQFPAGPVQLLVMLRSGLTACHTRSLILVCKQSPVDFMVGISAPARCHDYETSCAKVTCNVAELEWRCMLLSCPSQPFSPYRVLGSIIVYIYR